MPELLLVAIGLVLNVLGATQQLEQSGDELDAFAAAAGATSDPDCEPLQVALGISSE